MNIRLNVPLTIAPQAARYYFEGRAPLRVGDVARIVVEGDNPYIPWKHAFPARIRHVILLADASGRQWLVERPLL